MQYTMQDFINANHFEDKILKNADGTPVRYRRSGKTKLWKTRPNDFQIPIKRGLYSYGYITQDCMKDIIPKK